MKILKTTSFVSIYSYDNGIYAIDSQCDRLLRTAIHFVVDNGRGAIIDTGNNSSVKLALQATDRLGLKREDIDYICLTHIHLDHAGGAGAFMREFGEARLIVHPRGVRHMIDPGPLMAGVKDIYGEAETARLYGELLPVPEERIIDASDGMPVKLGRRELFCLHTPGHALHHISYHDPKANVVFTGDVCGVSYPELDVADRQSVIVISSPVQFDPQAMRDSIRRILALRPETLYLTHFSQLREPAARGDDLYRLIDAYAAIAEEAARSGEEGRCQRIVNGLRQLYDDETRRQGWILTREQMSALLDLDVELNAQGLDLWLKSSAKT